MANHNAAAVLLAATALQGAVDRAAKATAVATRTVAHRQEEYEENLISDATMQRAYEAQIRAWANEDRAKADLADFLYYHGDPVYPVYSMPELEAAGQMTLGVA